MSNLIVFHQSFLLYVCGIQCNGLVCEIGEEQSNLLLVHDWLTSGAIHERLHEEHMLEVEEF